VELTAIIESGAVSKVAFFDGSNLLAELSEEPYIFNAENLTAGKHEFYARLYDDESFNVTNIVMVTVGRQLPYTGSVFAIPGIIEAGLYDKFEGGNAQDISYIDVSVVNEGGFRPEEYVDALLGTAEGANVGWIAPGEWLEYSIDVDEPGYYSFEFRNASDNGNGGGPFHLELNGSPITDPIFTNSTGGWDVWTTQTAGEVALPQGEHILKVAFNGGEFNIGKMTFAYSSPLDYNQAVADAGENILLVLPENSAVLDGSNSFDPGNENLTYNWTQVYGPSVVTFSDNTIVNPEIISLVEGVYLIQLVVENESGYADADQLYVIVSESAEIPPVVNIIYPDNNAEFSIQNVFTILAEASDLDGTIQQLEFFENDVLIGTSTTEPYMIEWYFETIGSYDLTAVATDNDGNTATSPVVTVSAINAPPCEGTAYNGEYDWVFSPAPENPTLTFVPSIPGVGTPTCLLYYSTSPNPPFPGYGVTPNVPFQLVAEEGSTVYFYYTYSYPGQGEHTTVDHPDEFVVGDCIPTAIDPKGEEETSVTFGPNPVNDILNLQFSGQENTIMVYDIRGKLMDTFTCYSEHYDYNMNSFTSGVYFFRIVSQSQIQNIKVVKR
jgi:hypothetical protein